MKKTFIILANLLIILSATTSCRQIKEAKTLLKCEFRLNTIEKITLAGINVQQISTWSDLGFKEAAMLTAAIASGSMPLGFNLNIDIKNPNKETAALNKLDWILLIDDVQIAEGTTGQRVEIAPQGGVSGMSLAVSADLFTALKGQNGKSIVNFGLNLAGEGSRPTRITLRAKPTIMLGKKSITYPGYINIRTEYTSE